MERLNNGWTIGIAGGIRGVKRGSNEPSNAKHLKRWTNWWNEKWTTSSENESHLFQKRSSRTSDNDWFAVEWSTEKSTKCRDDLVVTHKTTWLRLGEESSSKHDARNEDNDRFTPSRRFRWCNESHVGLVQSSPDRCQYLELSNGPHSDLHDKHKKIMWMSLAATSNWNWLWRKAMVIMWLQPIICFPSITWLTSCSSRSVSDSMTRSSVLRRIRTVTKLT